MRVGGQITRVKILMPDGRKALKMKINPDMKNAH